MGNKEEQCVNTIRPEKPTVRVALENLFATLWDLDLCYSKRDFSVYWLGKSPRYISTLQSENGNGSFEVLLHAKEMITSTFKDFDGRDYQSNQYLMLMNVQHSLDAQIEEMQRNLIVE